MCWQRGASLATLPLILLGAGANTFALTAASFLAGVVAEFFTVVWETVNNTHIPERLLSRVGAHHEFWSSVSSPVGQLSAPVLAAAFGTAAVALTGGAVAAAAMVTASLMPAFPAHRDQPRRRVNRIRSETPQKALAAGRLRNPIT